MQISGLYIYPIKSCAGLSVPSAKVLAAGLQHDRRWMLVDGEGKFLSQREHPKMATLGVTLVESGLLLAAPGLPDCVVTVPASGPQMGVVVWKSGLDVPVATAEVNDWVSRFMGFPTYLVYLDDERKRAVTSSRGKRGDVVSFADGFPLLLTTTASLAALNAALSSPVPMDRFRPNVVVDGAVDAWAEDSWHMIKAGDVVLENMKPCARCIMTQVDQQRGEVVDKEPIRTLRKLRFSPEESGVLFGINLTGRALGALHVGQGIEITAFKEPVAILQRA